MKITASIDFRNSVCHILKQQHKAKLTGREKEQYDLKGSHKVLAFYVFLTRARQLTLFTQCKMESMALFQHLTESARRRVSIIIVNVTLVISPGSIYGAAVYYDITRPFVGKRIQALCI